MAFTADVSTEELSQLRGLLGPLRFGLAEGHILAALQFHKRWWSEINADNAMSGLSNLLIGKTMPQVEKESEERTAVHRAHQTLKKYTEFKTMLKKESLKTESARTLETELRATKFCFWHKSDGQGRPLMWLRPALLDLGESERIKKPERCALAGLYISLLEEGCSRADETKPGGAFSCVYDRRNLGFWHARRNAALCRNLLGDHLSTGGTLTDMFYSRTGHFYVLNAGWFWWSCFTLLRSFLSSEMKDKVTVIPGGSKELAEHLGLAPENLPEPWRSEAMADTESQ